MTTSKKRSKRFELSKYDWKSFFEHGLIMFASFVIINIELIKQVLIDNGVEVSMAVLIMQLVGTLFRKYVKDYSRDAK